MRKLQDKHLKQYHSYLVGEEKSKATTEKYLRDVRYFYEYAGANCSISKETVLAYKEHLKEAYKVTSINSMLASLNSFLSYLKWDDYKVKFIKVQRSSFCPEEKELTRKEYIKLLEAAKEKQDIRLFYIMQTICATGIRVSELQYITVEGLRKGRIEVFSKGKYRRIFIPSKLRKILLKYANKASRKKGPVFVTKNGKVIDRSNIWSDMKKLCEETGIEKDKVFPHNLRHLFAHTYYNLKKDLVKLADILGHSSVETTRIYTVTTGKEHERQISLLGLVVT